MILYQHVRALNDANGNPRRLYLVIDTDHPESTNAVDEGYEGRPTGLASAHELPSIDVAPSEYKRLLKRYPAVKR